MTDEPLEAVYSYVERAYIRLQAGDILIRCLEEENISPMQQWVEGLVLAGPQSISTLREILVEANSQKAQVMDDLYQVFNGLEGNLRGYGVSLTEHNALAVTHLTNMHFLGMLKAQNIVEEEKQIACLKLLKESRELMMSMAKHIRLLEEVETYLQDWLWGLVYQFAHYETNEARHFC